MADLAREEFHAPVLRHPAGAEHRLRGWVLGLSLAGFAAWAAWAVSGSGPSAWTVACGLGLWGWVSLLGWRAATRWTSGVLAWDGLLWSLDRGRASSPLCGRLEVALDLQRFLLVRFVGQDGRHAWLGLEPGRHAAGWAALRRAVYSRPRREPAAQGPTMPPAHRPDA
ncbi:hypothetical protein QRO11_17885 [Paracidovorax citrulli]|uniref:Toxin CptA n=2 Tax=Paracidovorax citrulli TaxID=80869 RepID=A1TLE2_PARC0|nr:hypothetical protein [Paracidovorax citrulli]ABM31780.1 conserved hypothetical protein [Paracidovorax citrulli AAC00-1]ATG95149.1 hypothetical protein CQB05_14900 [Paracidovorax citrulli]MVT29274.1 hypothetical protein [Paracidovorax citrulli]PVY65967.1 hypothetical protein C8E08_3355 [Paracidovorax citrulli]QCX11698.1 hypothetical protein APS58_2903 [Paracidovorax citrulli]